MMETPARKESDSWAYLIFVILGAALFLPVVFAGQTTLLPRYEDFAQWPNHREFIKNALANGYFPLWCEGLFSGLDFAGWGHSTSFYPAAFFFFFFKYAVASTLNQCLHFMIGISGFYFLARAIDLKKESAFISAIGYGSVYLLSALLGNYLSHSFVLAYVPWVFGLSIRTMRGKRLRDFLALALVIALQILGGHFEMFAVQNGALIIFISALIALDPKSGPFRSRALVLLPLVFASGALLATVNLLPSLSSYAQSYRSLGFSYSYFARASGAGEYAKILPLLVLFSFPVFFLFFIYSLKKARSAIYIALVLAVLVSLLNAFNWLDSFRLLYHIPVLNKFPPQGISLHLTFMCLFLMFGIGLDNFPEFFTRRPLLLTLAFIALEIIFSYLSYRLISRAPEPFAGEFAVLIRNYLLARKVTFVFMSVFGLAFVGAAIFSKNPLLRSVHVLEIVVLTDFLLTGLVLVPRNRQDILEPSPQYFNFLSGIDPGEYRIQSIFPSDLWPEVKIPVQTGVLNHTRSLDAFVYFSSLRYSEFLKCLDNQALVLEQDKIRDVKIPYVMKTGDFISPENLRMINLLNLKYIVGQAKNIKSSASYDLAYEYYRYQPKINVFKSGSFKKLTVRPPAKFGLLLYLTAGDRLDLKFEPKNNSDQGPVFNLYFDQGPEPMKLVYSRVIKDRLSLGLDSLAGKSGTLYFEFIPFSGKDRNSSEIALTIDNRSKLFKRLDFDDIDVFENPFALPRFFLVHGAKIIPDKNQRLEFIKSQEFHPDQTAVLENRVYIPFSEKYPALKGESASYLKERSFSGKYEVSIFNRAPAVLVFSEQYSPGWRAWLDGHEVKVLVADHCFQGVVIPSAGTHRLVLKYEPAGFRIALWTEIASIIWIAMIAGAGYRRRKIQGR